MKIVCKSLLFLLLDSSQASAQLPVPTGIAPVTSASFGFSNLLRGASPSGRIGLNGASAGITTDFSDGNGVMLDFGYLRASNVFGTGHRNDVLSYMAGPVWYLKRRPKFVVNVHALVGGARVRGVFPLSSGGFAVGYVHHLAWAFGGGIEHWFSHSMALRVSSDAVHTSFYDSSAMIHGQYDLRATASLLYYFGKGRGKRR